MSVEALLDLIDLLVKGGRCRRVLRILIAYANRTAEAKSMIAGWDKVIQFHLEEEDPFYIKVENGEARLLDGLAAKPSLVFQGEADLLYKVLTQPSLADEAMYWFNVRGDIQDAAKFRRIGQIVQKAHAKEIAFLRSLERLVPLG